MRNGHPLRRLTIPATLPDFASNDYLGLARSPHFLEMTQKESTRIGKMGSTGSRLLTGNSMYAEELEERIAHFHGFEACQLFGSGYMANLGLLSALEGPLYYDTHVHASTRDGIKLGGQPAYPLRHNDLNHVESRLRNRPGTVCVESIYSTDGSKAPLNELETLTQKYHSRLIVDEAHALGVYGTAGQGLTSSAVFAKVITFSKALGCFGGAVLGSKSLKSLLLNRARSCIYSTALPYPNLAAIHTAYNLFPSMDKERAALHSLIFAKTHLYTIPYASQSPPIAICHLRPPTVCKDVWRISLHAFNTPTEMEVLRSWIKSL